MEGIPMQSAGISTSDRERTGIREGALFSCRVGVRPREDARITDTMNEFTWFMGRRYKLVDAADHIGYEWTGRAHGSLADALATLAVQRWLEQRLVAE